MVITINLVQKWSIHHLDFKKKSLLTYFNFRRQNLREWQIFNIHNMLVSSKWLFMVSNKHIMLGLAHSFLNIISLSYRSLCEHTTISAKPCNMTTTSLNIGNFITLKLSPTNYLLWRENKPWLLQKIKS
jgi:hypothetical protein